MVWYDNISQLQYYNPLPKGLGCYCEIIVFPNDMILQGAFPAGSGTYTLVLEVMSPDGLTVYATGTTYFEYYFAADPITGQHFFNARLKSFVPAMCTNVCYIIHAKVTDGSTVVFEKYTERYCNSSCCDLARDITFTQGEGGTTTDDGTITTTSNPKITSCGDTLITLRTKYDCYDKFTNTYYGIPGTTLSGTATFGFEIVSNFRGRLVQRPREITREYSYNCRIQRVESQKVYLFEGFEYFPTWKMNEIEGQLHSTQIYIDDVRVEYDGGTPFKELTACAEIFKLEATMSDCTQRQVFGCDTGCSPAVNFNGAMQMYVIPAAASGEAFFNESGIRIADDYDTLLLYMRSLDGVSAVTDIDVTGLDCDVYKAFSISGTGYLPSYFYYDRVGTSNRVQQTTLDSLDDICPQYANPCPAPVIVGGDITIEDDVCPAPDLGTYTVEDMAASDIPFGDYGDWIVNDGSSSASLWNNEVTLTLVTDNAEMPEDPGEPGEPVLIEGMIIAVIGGLGRTDAIIVLDSNNSSMPADTQLTIDENGLIKYYGLATSSDETGSNITLTNIRYNIH